MSFKILTQKVSNTLFPYLSEAVEFTNKPHYLFHLFVLLNLQKPAEQSLFQNVLT